MTLPARSWYLPATQVTQMAALDALAIVPGAQGVGAVEPVAHDDPAGHAVQLSGFTRLGAFEYVPERQSS